ncbi:hypothetical protein [Saccharopolyspora sp. NPDC002376]
MGFQRSDQSSGRQSLNPVNGVHRRVEGWRTLVEAYCGAEAEAAELHDRSEVDWVRERTCMSCWRVLAAQS